MTKEQTFDPVVFKAYDIRGTVPTQLNSSFAKELGLALAKLAKQANVRSMAIGYDGRISSPELSLALQSGLHQGGINTIDLGLVHTPLVYFAAHLDGSGSGVAITGSHNPPDYNGFKMMLAGRTLHGDDIQEIASIMHQAANNSHEPNATAVSSSDQSASLGTVIKQDLTDTYIRKITEHIKLARPMHIAIDCGNGVGAVAASRLFRALGCQVDELFCNVDGRFPNHHPDPADPKNLQDLIRHLANSNCELGLAFDGDADRLGVVTKSGQIIWPDRQLILFARDVLSRLPKSEIIFDVKCSRHLANEISAVGGTPLMSQTGHSLIKAKLAQTKAPLAGEMSGHIFFNDRWYGFDDGIYAGARLLEILSRSTNPSEILEALPQGISTPELKLAMAEGQAHAFIDQLQQQGEFPNAISRITIDGIRCEYKNGFGLARASNTTPVVVLRFEADTQAELDLIQAEFKSAIKSLLPNASLPF